MRKSYEKLINYFSDSEHAMQQEQKNTFYIVPISSGTNVIRIVQLSIHFTVKCSNNTTLDYRRLASFEFKEVSLEMNDSEKDNSFVSGHSRPLFLYFRLFNTQLTVTNVLYK